MARQKSVKFGLFRVELGDGASPEVFEAPCALRSKGFQLQGQSSQAYLMDCENPDAASWASQNVNGQSATMTGSGTLDPDDLTTWWEWFKSGVAKNARVGPRLPAASGGGYWAGAFVLTNLSINSAKEENAGLATIEVEMLSDGEIVWTPATS